MPQKYSACINAVCHNLTAVGIIAVTGT